MAEDNVAMAVDEPQLETSNSSLPCPTTPSDAPPRPTPRKLPKFPVDLQMPMTVYWPYDDNKIIRSLREYEYGGPLPPQTTAKSLKELLESMEDKSELKEEKAIPLPGVRVLQQYEVETEAGFAMPEKTYLKYSPPSWFETSVYFERGRVEYCIDDEDLNWLAEQQLPEHDLDEEAMEILIDVLEKESYRQLEFRQITTQIREEEPVAEDDDDQPCAACGDKDSDDSNLILFCDGCDLPVHQQCIDLNEVPDGDWYCDACVYRIKLSGASNTKLTKRPSSSASSSTQSRKPFINSSIPIPCILCGMVEGGVFKNTNVPGRLVHVVCALMTPEVWFEKGWANVSKAVNARKNTVCQVCGFAGGVVKCSQRGCNNHHHVTCARENGQLLSFNVPDPNENVEAEEDDLEEQLRAIDRLDSKSNHSHGSLLQCGQLGDSSSDMHVDLNGSTLDESTSEVDILGDSVSLNASTASISGLEARSGEKGKNNDPTQKPKKRKKKTKVKPPPHQPYQSLCGLHSATIKVKKLEEARKASLTIPVEVGKFLEQEQMQDENEKAEDVVGDTTTFSKSVDIMKKYHSKRLLLQKPIFDRVVEYWKEKRFSRRLGHMPLIFQLHALVTHFKEDFDAGRKLTNRPRQVELTLAQYTPQKKFEILKQLRDNVELLRTMLDLVKKREVKKKLAMEARLKLFDAVVKPENSPAQAIRALYRPPPKSDKRVTYFTIQPDAPLTIKIPTSAFLKHKKSIPPITPQKTASPPPRKKVAPFTPPASSSNASPVVPSSPIIVSSASRTPSKVAPIEAQKTSLKETPPVSLPPAEPLPLTHDQPVNIAPEEVIVVEKCDMDITTEKESEQVTTAKTPGSESSPCDNLAAVNDSIMDERVIIEKEDEPLIEVRQEPEKTEERKSETPARIVHHHAIDISDSPPRSLSDLVDVTKESANILYGAEEGPRMSFASRDESPDKQPAQSLGA